ncbi:hypothetical protein AWRI1631_163200 [Saccharomyces cerevisiae AWRI1631]|uniref:Uncharacterized protein n=1 Tax=Saccharomyces cerevisiae (strain AWRI1631) TaxID=545124 RepID=B5VTK8_YEAS6|nr:hypothetical protein AWRI1631_163200 [Saccharomyces cerevisiae AWRI1631]
MVSSPSFWLSTLEQLVSSSTWQLRAHQIENHKQDIYFRAV